MSRSIRGGEYLKKSRFPIVKLRFNSRMRNIAGKKSKSKLSTTNLSEAFHENSSVSNSNVASEQQGWLER